MAARKEHVPARQRNIKTKPRKVLTLDNLSIAKTPDTKAYATIRRTRGLKFGLSPKEHWAGLFELNERLPKHKKMTDEEIKRQMLKEFPDHLGIKALGGVGEKSKHGMTVNQFRKRFNQGKLTPHPPQILSKRYDINGNEVNPRTGKPDPKHKE